MHPFRRVGARLSLALALVVAGALAVVWVALVPTLQHRLVNGRLALLAQSAREIERSETAAPDHWGGPALVIPGGLVVPTSGRHVASAEMRGFSLYFDV